MDPQKLSVLNEVLEKLALGDYGARCEISPENDEVDTIANSINNLAEKFEIAVTERDQAREDLEALNRQLEQRIEDRTAQLRESEALMRVVTDSVPVCLAYVDAGHRFRLRISVRTNTCVSIPAHCRQRPAGAAAG